MRSWQLRWLQLGMLGHFYGSSVLRRPWRLVEFARAVLTDREETYLDQQVRTPAPEPHTGRRAPTEGVGLSTHRRRRTGGWWSATTPRYRERVERGRFAGGATGRSGRTRGARS